MNKRHQKILELISNRRKVSVNELAELTGVSLVTIRSDLTVLAQQNYIMRRHGFAEILDRDRMSDRVKLNFALKQKLAKAAMKRIADGDAVFIEGGSTNALLARELLDFKGDLVVITVCTYIASLLKEAPFDVILLGGVVQAKSESVVGPLTRLGIAHTHFNKAFIGIDGYQSGVGFTGRDMMRADIINCVLDKGADNIIITDSSKFSQIHPYAIKQALVGSVITDKKIPPAVEADLQRHAITCYKV